MLLIFNIICFQFVSHNLIVNEQNQENRSISGEFQQDFCFNQYCIRCDSYQFQYFQKYNHEFYKTNATSYNITKATAPFLFDQVSVNKITCIYQNNTRVAEQIDISAYNSSQKIHIDKSKTINHCILLENGKMTMSFINNYEDSNMKINITNLNVNNFSQRQFIFNDQYLIDTEIKLSINQLVNDKKHHELCQLDKTLKSMDELKELENIAQNSSHVSQLAYDDKLNNSYVKKQPSTVTLNTLIQIK